MESYPLPCIDELFSKLQGAKYFSRLDLCEEYFNIPIVDEDMHKTVFSCRYGTYEYLVMLFSFISVPVSTYYELGILLYIR